MQCSVCMWTEMEMAVIEKHFYNICTYFLIENDKKETLVCGFTGWLLMNGPPSDESVQ